MRIRKLAQPDREPILRVLRSDDTFTEEEIAVATEVLDAAVAQPGRDYHILVCEDETVVGYVCYGPTPMTLGAYDLYWIATHREARGRGVARRLVEAMEAELGELGARVVRVETSQLDAYGAARAFYLRLGYGEAGRIRDFYRPGDDLVIFAKGLSLAAADVAHRPVLAASALP
ncbi:MAG TPA: GNAT family N-acetyltransferase [Haliangiales bacterium]|nr:GNAT family N-acetyltransferase [Haliangiales bacterium]